MSPLQLDGEHKRVKLESAQEPQRHSFGLQLLAEGTEYKLTLLTINREWTRLGKGSFGCVYKGEYLGLEVAIKEVFPSNEYDFNKYFERECKVMAEVSRFWALVLGAPN